MDLSLFLNQLKIDFNQIELYQKAFQHVSFTNRNKKLQNYETLEFFGDSIVGFVVAEYLFAKFHQNNDPNEKIILVGTLSEYKQRLVSDAVLTKAALKLGMNEFACVAPNTKKQLNETTILADIFEAFTAALYSDLGLSAVRTFLRENLIIPFWSETQQNNNYRSILQEFLQKTHKTTPNYDYHAKENCFVATCRCLEFLTEGAGKNKQIAAKNAAALMLKKLKKHINEKK